MKVYHPFYSQPNKQWKDEYIIRPLAPEDFQKGFGELLGQLTSIGNLDDKKFRNRLEEIKLEGTSLVLVVEDTGRKKIIGAGTLHIERKFSRSAGSCGHIEDIVVLSNVRSGGIGRKIIEELKELGSMYGCYKLILNSEEKNVPFYEKLGFQRKEVQMALYMNPSLSKL